MLTTEQFLQRTAEFSKRVNCVSLAPIDTPDRCECCGQLADTVRVVGFNGATQAVEDLGCICRDCLLYFSYDELPDYLED